MKKKEEKDPILYVGFLKRNHLLHEQNETADIVSVPQGKSIVHRFWNIVSILILICLVLLSIVGMTAILYPPTRDLLLGILSVAI